MKVKDIRIPDTDGWFIVLTSGNRCVNFDQYGRNQGFGECEVKSIQLGSDMGATWIWAEIENLPKGEDDD